MSLSAKIRQIQPRCRQSIAGKVRESFAEINEARERGVTWPDLARAFRASKIRVTAHSLRSTYYQVAESLQAAAEVAVISQEPSVNFPEQSAASLSIAGVQTQDCAREVQDICKQGASNSQDASSTAQAAGGQKPNAGIPQEHAIKPSERVAALATQPRPAPSHGLTDSNGFVRNIPDDEI